MFIGNYSNTFLKIVLASEITASERFNESNTVQLYIQEFEAAEESVDRDFESL